MDRFTFGIGLSMIITQLVVLVGVSLTFLDWSWLTEKVIILIVAGVIIVGWNIVALIALAIGISGEDKK